MKLLIFLILFISSISFAQEIISHSEQRVLLRYGSQAKLKFETDIQPTSVRWVFGQTILSNDKFLSTPNDWEPGYYAVNLIVEFEKMFVSVPYEIQIQPLEDNELTKKNILSIANSTVKSNFKFTSKDLPLGVSLGSYSKIASSDGKVFMVGKAFPMGLGSDFVAETTDESILFLKQKEKAHVTFFEDSKAAVKIGEDLISVNPIRGDIFLKIKNANVNVNFLEYVIKPSKENSAMSIIESDSGKYQIFFHLGEGYISIEEKGEKKSLVVKPGSGIMLNSNQGLVLLSGLGCGDKSEEKFKGELKIENCLNFSPRLRNKLSRINADFDNYLNINVTPQGVNISRDSKDDEFFPSKFQIEDRVTEPKKSKSFTFKNDNKLIVNSGYKLLEQGKYHDLSRLSESVSRYSSPSMIEIQGINVMASGKCESIESFYDKNYDFILGRRFHFYSALALLRCDKQEKAILRFDDVRWWTEDSTLKKRSSINVNKYTGVAEVSPVHRIIVGHSSNPSFTSQNKDLAISELTQNEGALVKYYYERNKYLGRSENMQYFKSKTSLDFVLPFVESEANVNRFSISETPNLSLPNILESLPYLEGTKIGLNANLEYKLNVVTGTLASSEFNYDVGLILTSFFSEPSLSYRRKLILDATDRAEAFDFTYGLGVLPSQNNNLSSISKDIIFRIGRCLGFLCKFQIELNEIGYLGGPSEDLSAKGYTLLAGIEGPVANRLLYGIDMKLRQMDLLSNGTLSHNQFEASIMWEFLPRKEVGASIESVSVESSVPFLNYEVLNFMLIYQVSDF